MKIIWKSALAAAALCAISAMSAQAAISVDATACVSVASPQGCRFNGNVNGNAGNQNGFDAAQNAYNLYNNSVPSANPDIVLNYLGDTDAGFPGTFTGAGGLNGTWSLPGFSVNFVAVKSANQFVLYGLPTPMSSGNWSTAGLLNNQGGQQGLSHLMFFGQRGAAVPEPATWLMMIAGFGAIGGMMRKRKARTALA